MAKGEKTPEQLERERRLVKKLVREQLDRYHALHLQVQSLERSEQRAPKR